jgi:hypothetical protein
VAHYDVVAELAHYIEDKAKAENINVDEIDFDDEAKELFEKVDDEVEDMIYRYKTEYGEVEN